MTFRWLKNQSMHKVIINSSVELTNAIKVIIVVNVLRVSISAPCDRYTSYCVPIKVFLQKYVTYSMCVVILKSIYYNK
jgi:hypothetical protein